MIFGDQPVVVTFYLGKVDCRSCRWMLAIRLVTDTLLELVPASAHSEQLRYS